MLLTGSDGILHVMKKSQSDTAAELCRDLSALQQLRRRHPSSEVREGFFFPVSSFECVNYHLSRTDETSIS